MIRRLMFWLLDISACTSCYRIFNGKGYRERLVTGFLSVHCEQCENAGFYPYKRSIR
jgi:RNase P subunit RPR2